MRAIAYVRASTIEQEDSGLGLEAQRRAIEAECERRDWPVIRFEQDVASGKSLNGRPGLQRAMDAIEADEADVLVAAKLDRVSRSVHDFCGLLERARKRGWSLVVLDVGADTTSAMGEAMANMAATFAQLERRRIAERTKEALAIRRSQGIRLGRPRMVPEDVRARICDMRDERMTLRAIAARDGATGPTEIGDTPTATGSPD